LALIVKHFASVKAMQEAPLLDAVSNPCSPRISFLHFIAAGLKDFWKVANWDFPSYSK
jgi:hypothetical protein